MSRPAGIAVTVLLAVVAGWAGYALATPAVADPLPVGDRVHAAVEALRDSHVYVAPDSADLLSGAELVRLEAAAAASRPQAFVVVWEHSSEGGFYLPSEGLRQIGAELGRPGHYVSIGRDGLRGTVAAEDVGIDGDYTYATGFAVDEPVTPQTISTRLTEMLAQNDGREFSTTTTPYGAGWGGTTDTIVAGVLIGAVAGAALAALAGAAWFIARSRLRSRS